MGSDQKRIMVLGAGIYQLAGIRAAVDLGLFTVTVDYLPDNIGHRIGHRYVNASTTDPAAVLAAARELSIDGIVTFASDVAIPTVAHVAEALGLPGCGVGVAHAMCNKARFRALQRERGLDAPAFAAGHTPDQIDGAVARLRPPLVVKPVDTSGSRGIERVDRVDRAAWLPAFERALGFSRSGQVCLEELVEGIDVTGEGLMQAGALAFAAFTRKHRRDFVVLGHELPGALSGDEERRAGQAIEATCRALGYRDGPLDVDLIVSPDRVVIIEMGPRTGGNGIPPLVDHAAGMDLHAAAVQAAIGEAVVVPATRPVASGGSMVIGAPRAGVLATIAGDAELRARVPEIIDHVTTACPGDRVPAFVHGGASLGYCVFARREGASWATMVERVTEALGITIADAA